MVEREGCPRVFFLFLSPPFYSTFSALILCFFSFSRGSLQNSTREREREREREEKREERERERGRERVEESVSVPLALCKKKREKMPKEKKNEVGSSLILFWTKTKKRKEAVVHHGPLPRPERHLHPRGRDARHGDAEHDSDEASGTKASEQQARPGLAVGCWRRSYDEDSRVPP